MIRRAPRPLALAVTREAQRLAPRTVLAAAQQAWEGVVGTEIAAAARPVAERDGTLTISCKAAVWAQEIELMAPALAARLNEALEGAPIDRLRCISAPASDERWGP